MEKNQNRGYDQKGQSSQEQKASHSQNDSERREGQSSQHRQNDASNQSQQGSRSQEQNDDFHSASGQDGQEQGNQKNGNGRNENDSDFSQDSERSMNENDKREGYPASGSAYEDVNESDESDEHVSDAFNQDDLERKNYEEEEEN
jgi:hypothetical protein